ncbi:3-dehydroquinate synthase [Akkermansiaceae bacterium]|nr:3-dehydroquinate synthase [Akkermansiaceae bacterium]MDB4290298.1 3-dehydroquinate synthase [bacterium]MDB4144009.1 3-dehydroquinate synthase [Akkermansiaceae bacterium]MDB4274980.1 3-dehydroquinate synthase [Akkermansiaceae bacterium]MDB4282357.1 3-dehydroquinate synthase [Akkermansiaceae bacterium]
MNSVHVDLGDRSYEILVEPGLLSQTGERILAAGLKGRAAIITDTNVAPHYLEKVEASLADAGYETSTHVAEAGEASKSMTEVERLSRSLIQAGHDRSSFVVALGGGVVGDLAGFVAAIFYRGIPFVQIPTTIVSQVDSAVGGKTGVNAPEGKNLIGAFHQPRLVLTDPETLLTLPGREFREGFAEVIKHAAIRDFEMIADLEALDPLNQDVPAELIARNVAIKARVVEEDEKETSGTRALLNFGHTIGHGIEASVPYGTLLHGEAISLGIRAALKLSEDHAGLKPEESDRILKLLEHFQLPLRLSDDISSELVLEKLGRDKKFSGGKRTFVLLDRLGNGVTCDTIPTEAILPAIESLRS